MENALVSVATGALSSVIGKLAELLEKKYTLFKGARSEVASLKAELEHMHAFLEKLSSVGDPDAQVKLWMAEVRELSYDMEDSINDFMLRVDGSRTPAAEVKKGLKGLIDKITSFFTKIKARCQIAKEIQGLKRLVNEAGERHARYKLDDNISSTGSEAAVVDSRVRTLYKDKSELVGIDGPKDELIKLLTGGDDVQSQQLRVVSIVGSGGLGKTTLANQVHNTLGEKFKHRAFVSASRNPDMLKILKTIYSEVTIPRYIDSPEELNNNNNVSNLLSQIRQVADIVTVADEQQLMSKISDFLKDKRYMVVVDDIWNAETWEIIKCVFPRNSHGSRIITTTRINEVAESCCSSYGDHVYKLSPLNVMDSKRLFLQRIFGSEEQCPSHLKDLSDKILTKCDGLPLAIIAISGLLANKVHTVDQWNKVQNSIGYALERDQGVRGMFRILSLSYLDLPHHLKTCLLYLSKFPEHYAIEKKSLVRRWIAEGFIPEEHGYTKYELGERCFHELINRSLIQPVKTNIFGEVKNCQVHGVILDFIVSKSVEENFFTFYGVQNPTPGQQKKVRRLCLKENKQEHGTSSGGLILCHARSVTMFGDFKLPPLVEFRILRVLDIEDCNLSKDHHSLTSIGMLFQLKYLSLKNTNLTKLPETVTELQYLETLNLKGNKITELPASIVRLGRLSHLLIDGKVKLPDGIQDMLALQELRLINVLKQPINFVQGLCQLTNLRKLSLSLESAGAADAGRHNEYTKNMVNSICKLGTLNLHSLAISIGKDCDDSFLHGSWCPPPSSLGRLVIKKACISRVPNWMGSSLVNLHQLYLHMKEVRQEDIDILGGIPVLLRLVLYVKPKKRQYKQLVQQYEEEEEEEEEAAGEGGGGGEGEQQEEEEEEGGGAEGEEEGGGEGEQQEEEEEGGGAEGEEEGGGEGEEEGGGGAEGEEEGEGGEGKQEKEQEQEEEGGAGVGGEEAEGGEGEQEKEQEQEEEGGEEEEQQEQEQEKSFSLQEEKDESEQEEEESFSLQEENESSSSYSSSSGGERGDGRRLDITGSHGFPLLRYLKIDGTDPRLLGLKFEAGSMPKLEELALMFIATKRFGPTNGASFFGVENLSHLASVDCEIYYAFMPKTNEFESAIKRAVEAHPNHPRLTMRKKDIVSDSSLMGALVGLGLALFLFVPVVAVVAVAALMFPCTIL